MAYSGFKESRHRLVNEICVSIIRTKSYAQSKSVEYLYVQLIS